MVQAAPAYGDTRSLLTVDDVDYLYYSLDKVSAWLGDTSRLPISLKILLENLLRFDNGSDQAAEEIREVGLWLTARTSVKDISFRPARVLTQDFTGVPFIADLAMLREYVADAGADARTVDVQVPVHLIVDHSIMVDAWGHLGADEENLDLEYRRNGERYSFLKWGAENFGNLSIIPPGNGICHQVNLELIARVVWTDGSAGETAVAYPDTCIGMDSHTTMVNGIGVLGWGVGGIEAEAAMLGEPVSMRLPEVVGVKLIGELASGVTATDLVLTCTQILRAKGVVGRLVEFYGSGVATLPVADRATLANMAPEYGATCGFFGIDDKTLDYLRLTGRDEHQIKLTEAYARIQGLWVDPAAEPIFTETIEIDLRSITPSVAGPSRPQDRMDLADAGASFANMLVQTTGRLEPAQADVEQTSFAIRDGDIALAAITSCTNTSNPAVMVAAGLLARNANRAGLRLPEWVKASLSPGSRVVADYLARAGLQEELDTLGFHLAGFGCMTCAGNSGPLSPAISAAIEREDIVAAAVLSGNRNFEGRISPDIKANFLASPPLVVAFALKGSVREDITSSPLGFNADGQPVYLRDIWPNADEVRSVMDRHIDSDLYRKRRESVGEGDDRWRQIATPASSVYAWQQGSTYIAKPPFLNDGVDKAPIRNARPLAIFGDSITTDHISPAGAIRPNSPAAQYLRERNITPDDFNSYGTRRGNHEIMMRGTFANPRVRNLALAEDGTVGGYTRHLPAGEIIPIYESAMRYRAEGTQLVVLAGKEYGTGSSRDWAAKGTRLLGVRAIIAQSFERIHRSNLICMGILPVEFLAGDSVESLGLSALHRFSIVEDDDLSPNALLGVIVTAPDGSTSRFNARCRIDTHRELSYFKAGGILPFVARKFAGERVAPHSN